MNLGDRLIVIETNEYSKTEFVYNKQSIYDNDKNLIFSSNYFNELNNLLINLDLYDTSSFIYYADTLQTEVSDHTTSERYIANSGVVNLEFIEILKENLGARFTESDLTVLEDYEYGIFELFNFKEIISRSFYLYNKDFYFNKEKVRAFFYRPDRREVPAEILYYDDNNDFAIGFELENTNETAYFAILPEYGTIENMYNYVMSKSLLSSPQTPFENDEIIFPVLNFDLLGINKNLQFVSYGPDNNEIPIITLQRLRFLFSVKQKDFSLLPSRRIDFRTDSSNGRKLYFNRPFLFFIKNNNSNEAYFFIWISNTELMNSFVNENI